MLACCKFKRNDQSRNCVGRHYTMSTTIHLCSIPKICSKINLTFGFHVFSETCSLSKTFVKSVKSEFLSSESNGISPLLPPPGKGAGICLIFMDRVQWKGLNLPDSWCFLLIIFHPLTMLCSLPVNLFLPCLLLPVYSYAQSLSHRAMHPHRSQTTSHHSPH